jgi:hypothetical protein
MTTPRLTKAHKHALEWLPADMSFRFPTRLSDPNYLDLVDLSHMGLAECACDVVAEMDCDPSYRLTPAGVAAREKMEKGDA